MAKQKIGKKRKLLKNDASLFEPEPQLSTTESAVIFTLPETRKCDYVQEGSDSISCAELQMRAEPHIGLICEVLDKVGKKGVLHIACGVTGEGYAHALDEQFDNLCKRLRTAIESGTTPPSIADGITGTSEQGSYSICVKVAFIESGIDASSATHRLPLSHTSIGTPQELRNVSGSVKLAPESEEEERLTEEQQHAPQEAHDLFSAVMGAAIQHARDSIRKLEPLLRTILVDHPPTTNKPDETLTQRREVVRQLNKLLELTDQAVAHPETGDPGTLVVKTGKGREEGAICLTVERHGQSNTEKLTGDIRFVEYVRTRGQPGTRGFRS